MRAMHCHLTTSCRLQDQCHYLQRDARHGRQALNLCSRKNLPPSNMTHITQKWLHNNFYNHISPNVWPPSSFDLILLNNYVWGIVKKLTNEMLHNNKDLLKAARSNWSEYAATFKASLRLSLRLGYWWSYWINLVFVFLSWICEKIF